MLDVEIRESVQAALAALMDNTPIQDRRTRLDTAETELFDMISAAAAGSDQQKILRIVRDAIQDCRQQMID